MEHFTWSCQEEIIVSKIQTKVLLESITHPPKAKHCDNLSCLLMELNVTSEKR